MLVLTRKQQEKIRIGDHITITVLRTKGKAVRLGIEAPAEIPVIRGELSFDKVDETEAPIETLRELKDGKSGANGFGRPFEEVGRTIAVWPAEPARVSLQRVPRDQVAKVLPHLADDRGPLRDMLDRRTVAM
jgi:carbon storage regulator CsrA